MSIHFSIELVERIWLKKSKAFFLCSSFFLNLLTFSLYDVLIWLGEYRCWSILGLKGCAWDWVDVVWRSAFWDCLVGRNLPSFLYTVMRTWRTAKADTSCEHHIFFKFRSQWCDRFFEASFPLSSSKQKRLKIISCPSKYLFRCSFWSSFERQLGSL